MICSVVLFALSIICPCGVSLSLPLCQLPRRAFLSSAAISVTTTLLPVDSIGLDNLNTDEFTIQYDPSVGPLGLEIKDVSFSTAIRVQVTSVLPSSQVLGQQSWKDYISKSQNYLLTSSYDEYLQEVNEKFAPPPGLIISSVNDKSTERTNAQGVRQILSEEIAKMDGQPILVTLKSSSGFNDSLVTLKENETVTTNISPSSPSSPAQDLKITQLKKPLTPTATIAGAGDLVEVAYRGYYLPRGITDPSEGSGRVPFDSSSARNDDSTIQFVLGKQPFGQFPPSFNVGIANMRVGEVRGVEVPPVLGYGEQGFKKFGVPGSVFLYFEIELKAVNALYK